MQIQEKLEASRFVVVTGRVDRWMRHPEQGTLNVSCTTKVANPDNLWEDMHYASTALRGAAGENLVVNSFSQQEPTITDWSFYLSPSHPDFSKMPPALLQKHGIKAKHAIIVADSMTESCGPGTFSIEESWREFYDLLKAGVSVAVILTMLRPEGQTNKHGLVASGPLSFLKIYEAIAHYAETGTLTSYLQIFSCLNEVLRRGGHYKNGAIVATLDATHEDALEFISLPLSEIPYLKKALRVYPEILQSTNLVNDVLAQVNAGSLWLEKDLGTHDGEQLWSNVCKGISLKDRGSCLISHVNAGQIEKLEDWVQAWRDAMNFICAVFEVGAVRSAGIYRDPKDDRQVAVGVVGLANCLSYHGIAYQEFVDSFERFLNNSQRKHQTISDYMIWCIACGVQDAADVARSHNMRAAFSIEPSESCAFRYTDLRGYTCVPNIDAPVAIPGSGRVRRNSEAIGDAFYEHGPVEVASAVGADLHRRNRECWQRLFNSTGLPHMSSYEIWKEWNAKDLKQWFDGPLLTSYYRRPVLTAHLEKGRKIMTAKQFEASCNVDDLYCEACGD